MNKLNIPKLNRLGLLAVAALLASLTACSNPPREKPNQPVPPQRQQPADMTDVAEPRSEAGLRADSNNPRDVGGSGAAGPATQAPAAVSGHKQR